MQKTQTVLTVLLTTVPATAWAAEITAGIAAVAVGLIVIAGIVVVIAANGRLQSVKRDHQELTERLFMTERTVDRLQKERTELQKAVATKEQQIAIVQEERGQIQEMLTTLRGQVEKVARIDGLTGIANRRQLELTLDDEIKRAVRARRPLSLLVAELDLFEDYRAATTDVAADAALQKIAAGLTDEFRRAGDLIARSDAARFAVVLPGTDDETANRFAEKLRRSIYDLCIPFTNSEIADRITASVGFVCVPANRLSKTDNVLTMAETALRQAQADGHNCVAQIPVAA